MLQSIDSKNVPARRDMSEHKEGFGINTWKQRTGGRVYVVTSIRSAARCRASVLEVSDAEHKTGDPTTAADAMSSRADGAVDVAKATGVSTDTLRHYERKGLLPRVTRTAAGYRQYSADTVDRVLLIQRALIVGFSLAGPETSACWSAIGAARRALAFGSRGERLEQLNRRIEEMLALRDELRAR
jgi:DNA-binding transcriptional MerR regulator